VFSTFLWLATLLPALDAEPAVFELESANGSIHTGQLVELSDDWSIKLGGPESMRLPGRETISLRRPHSHLPARPRGEHVVLTSGDQFPARVTKLDGEQLLVMARLSDPAAGAEQELRLPLSALSVVWLAAPAESGNVEGLVRRQEKERRRHDALWLPNGDLVEGMLAGLDDRTVTLKQEQGSSTSIKRNRIIAIALNTELALKPRLRAPYAHLVLANGSRLSLATARLDGPALAGKTLYGTPLRVPLSEILSLDLFQGRADYLSDLKPGRYEETPYFSARWGYQNDASVAGGDLLLGGSCYDKGIGMHSASRLTYALNRAYRRFEAWVGMDERTGRAGNVTIQVVVDGKPQDLGWNGELSGRDRPRLVRVSVAGTRELTLVVGFGRRGDVQDHVDWAEARLIRSP